MRRTVALLVALAAWLACAAQSTVSGTVTDNTGAAVGGVTVKLVKGRLTRSFTRTATNGTYTLKVPQRNDSLSITFEHLTYDKETRPLPQGGTLHVVLTPRSNELREVVITAPSVKLRGDTLSFFLDMFKGKGDIVLEDALKKLPGITVEDNGTIKYLGKDISNFYVEGLDMLGGRYAVATKSIPAEYVSSVEVLSNHQDLKIDKDKVSDNVALNVRLKSKALFKPVGTAELAGGYGDKRGYYRVSGTGMIFNKGYQTLVTVKGGNIERFADNSIRVIVGGQSGSDYKAASVVPSPGGSRPPIRASRYENARDRMVSANTIVKTGKDATLRANASYAYSHNDYSSGSLVSYFTGGDAPLVVEETTAPGSSTHTPTLDVEYRINADDLYLSNSFRATGSFEKQAVPGTNDGIAVAQSRRMRAYSLSDIFSRRSRLGNREWNITSAVSFDATPTMRLNITGRSGEPGFNAVQTARSSTVKAKQSASTSWLWGSSQLYLPISVGYNYTDLATSLTRADALHSNRLYSHIVDAGVRPRYEYTTSDKTVNINVSVPVTLKYLNGKNVDTSARKATTRLLVAPDMVMIIRPNGSNDITLFGTYGTSVGDLLSLLTAPVQKSYRTLDAGSGLLASTRGWSARASYRYKRPLDFFLASVDMSYSSSRNNLLGSQYVQAAETFLTTIASDNTTDVYSATARVTKTVRSIGADLNLAATYTWNRREIFQQQLYVRYYSRSFGINPSVRLRPWHWGELNWRGSIDKNFNRYLGSRSSYFNFTEDASLSIFPGAGVELKATGEHLRREVGSGVFKNIVLLDFGITWIHGKWRWNLALNNLLDKRSYSYTLFNGLDTWRYDYRLKGRMGVLGVAFTL